MTMTRRRKYLFSDRAQAEVAYLNEKDRAFRLAICIAQAASAEYHSHGYTLRVWYRMGAGFAWWALVWDGGTCGMARLMADGDSVGTDQAALGYCRSRRTAEDCGLSDMFQQAAADFSRAELAA